MMMTSSPNPILDQADRDALNQARKNQADADLTQAAGMVKLSEMYAPPTDEQRAERAEQRALVKTAIDAAQEAGDKREVARLKATLLVL